MICCINKYSKLLTASVVLFCFSLMSCETEVEETEVAKIAEGRISFEITYPYYTDDFMVVLLPDQMIMEFKDNKYKNTVSKGGLFTTTLIADCNKKELILMLDFGSKQIYTKLDKALTDTMMLQYPIPDLLKLKYSDSVAGLPSERYMAVFASLEDGYDCEIVTSDRIQIENSNWCNQYSELEDVLLEYEISQYGLVMNFKTDSVFSESVSSKVFSVPDDFKEVSLEQMLFQMQEIFNQIIE